MPTLAEVAERAGVSIATVSKVLSDTPYVSEETREKVMQAVKELGYVPNLAGRALSSGRTHIIAVVFPYIYDTVFTDPFVLHMLEGVEAECSERGYNLLLSTPRLTKDGPDENYLRLVQSGYMDGIVALDNVPLASVVTPAHRKGIPAVAIGYGQHRYFVRSDDLQGSKALMEHVLSLGHKRIGIITVAAPLNFSVPPRMLGFHTAAEAHGIDFATLPKCEGDFSITSGAKCVAQLLQQHLDLTAIICINDRMALGAIQQVQRNGLLVPDDLTIVGYDDIPLARFVVPALTTIDQHAPELGRIATQMLFDILNDKTPDPVTIPTQLVIRQSSAPPKK